MTTEDKKEILQGIYRTEILPEYLEQEFEVGTNEYTAYLEDIRTENFSIDIQILMCFHEHYDSDTNQGYREYISGSAQVTELTVFDNSGTEIESDGITDQELITNLNIRI